MSFRVERREEFLKSLEEAERLILEREKLLKERAVFAVKIRDYTAEAIYVVKSEMLVEKRVVMGLFFRSFCRRWLCLLFL